MINSVTNSVSSVDTSSSPSALTQSSFLKLLTAELQNQDPDSPMESSQMLDQFATLNNVQAITSLEAKVGKFIDSQSSNSMFTSSSLIGSEVTYESIDFEAVNGAFSGEIEPLVGVGEVKLSVIDSSGAVVSEQTIDTSGSDVSYPFTVDGLNDADYTVSATYSVEGITKVASVVQSAQVQGVRSDSGQVFFKLSSGKFALISDFKSINS